MSYTACQRAYSVGIYGEPLLALFITFRSAMTGHLDAFIPLERNVSKIILDPSPGDDSDLSVTQGRSGVLQWSDLLSRSFGPCARL